MDSETCKTVPERSGMVGIRSGMAGNASEMEPNVLEWLRNVPNGGQASPEWCSTALQLNQGACPMALVPARARLLIPVLN